MKIDLKERLAISLRAAVGESGNEDYGYTWDVQIVEYGLGKDKRINWPKEPIVAAIPLYEGARVFVLTDSQHEPNGKRKEFGKSVRELVGWIENVKDTGTALVGSFQIMKSAKWLRDDLIDLFDRKKTDLLGLSHDVAALSRKIKIDGKTVLEPVRIVAVEVDVVYNPTNNGKFLRMAAAELEDNAAGQKEDSMWKRLLAALKGLRPELKDRIEAVEAKGDEATDAEVNELLAACLPEQKSDDLEKLFAAFRDKGTETEEAKKLLEKAQLTACAMTLKDEVKGSGLPELSQARLQKQFEGKIFETAQLTAAINEEKEYVDKLTGSGTVKGSGQIKDMQSEPDRLQAAVDKLMGVDVDEKYKDVEAFFSLRSAYVRMTGDTNLTGVITSADHLKLGESIMGMMRLPAAYASNSFTYVLGNSMYRRLVREYREVDYKEDILVSYNRNAQDFKTMEIIMVGYFGDLPDVDPEAKDYEEISMPTDIESTYAINQKGVLLSVTRKVIYNDDLKSVAQLVSKLGRAARRTHAKRAWNKIIDNATFGGDSKALFHADHGNLGATGLTADATGIATLTARLKAMYDQTEPDSSETLGLEAKYLWCSRAITEIAKSLNSSWPGASTPNPHAGRFGANHENIITIPLFSDANDWGLIASALDVELLEAAYLNGRREPEMFVADNPLVGQMFTADKMQYKIRHEYEFESADYRGFDKSVVT